MAFDYNRHKGSHGGSGGDSFWTSYSDLFLGLSTIFLLLYVTSSLRTGTDAIKAQVDNQKLTMKVEELKSQLKMYEQVKADYMNQSASKDEVQEYKELMDKLTLLKEEAKSDQERLAREALENENKAVALNKYQQLVRNVINANKVAKTKIMARNTVIDEQDETIDEQTENIENLESDVAQKKAAIAQREQQIEAAKQALDQNKRKLLNAYREQKITKQQYEDRARQLQDQSQRKIMEMQAANRTTQQQLNQVASELQGTQQALVGTQQALTGAQILAQQKVQEAQNAQTAAQNAQAAAQAARNAEAAARGEVSGLQGQISDIKAKYAADQAAARAALDNEIRKGKMDAAERARREGEFKAAAAKRDAEMQGKLAGLNGQLKDMGGQLAKAREEMDARREAAREIAKGFRAAGVKADIDMQTGEVVLDFGDSYFDSDSANLKPQMKDVIERAMPSYARSLFGNAKIANKISNVEIVGFASPTYKGRFVDPRSNKPEDKAALKYNMDLSYRRANSIFAYLVNNKDGEFAHQQDLLALMKVSGRSFLEVMKVQGRNPTSAAEFCKVNDCKKAQKVIVRFSMDGKK